MDAGDPERSSGAFHDTLSAAEADHGSYLMMDKLCFLSDCLLQLGEVALCASAVCESSCGVSVAV